VVQLSPDRDVRAMAALVLARAGNRAGAEKLAAELDKTFPLDMLVHVGVPRNRFARSG
jgi:hypothetical protein